METLDVSSLHRIQTLTEAPAKGHLPTMGRAVPEELLDSLQLLISIYIL